MELSRTLSYAATGAAEGRRQRLWILAAAAAVGITEPVSAVLSAHGHVVPSLRPGVSWADRAYGLIVHPLLTLAYLALAAAVLLAIRLPQKSLAPQRLACAASSALLLLLTAGPLCAVAGLIQSRDDLLTMEALSYAFPFARMAFLPIVVLLFWPPLQVPLERRAKTLSRVSALWATIAGALAVAFYSLLAHYLAREVGNDLELAVQEWSSGALAYAGYHVSEALLEPAKVALALWLCAAGMLSLFRLGIGRWLLISVSWALVVFALLGRAKETATAFTDYRGITHIIHGPEGAYQLTDDLVHALARLASDCSAPVCILAILTLPQVKSLFHPPAWPTAPAPT